MFWDQEFVGFLMVAVGRIPALLLAVVAQGAAVDRMSRWLGVDSIPPHRHRLIDPRGRLGPMGLPALLLSFFTWSRPTPSNKIEVRKAAPIALAGWAANLLLAALSGLSLQLLLVSSAFQVWDNPAGPVEWVTTRLFLILVLLSICSLMVNLFLFLLSLIPLFPLIGEQVLLSLLPATLADRWQMLRPFTPVLLLLGLLLAGPACFELFGRLSDPFLRTFAGLGFDETKAVLAVTSHALWGR